MISARVLSKIATLASARFEIDEVGDRASEFRSLASEALPDCAVVRLRRKSVEPAGWRTLLVAGTQGLESARAANRWAAAVRDALLEPETADLYLLLWTAGISESVCAAMEADDKFCRRFVARPQETDDAFLRRTFLAPLGTISGAAAISEPLAGALERAATSNPWLRESIRSSWKRALLSGKTGTELSDELALALSRDGETR